MPGLTLKQRLFVEAYLGKAAGNATQAARMAGYAEHEVTGCRLLRNAKVRELVEKRVSQVAMEANRVLAKVSAIAEESDIVADQLRALTRLGDHYGLWDAKRTDEAADELARAQKAAADEAADEATIAELMEEHGLSREAAEDLVADLREAHAAELAKRSMGDELKAALLGGPLWRVSNARKDEIISEVCRRHGLMEPEPDPRPARPCGFRELPPPAIRARSVPPIEPEPERTPEVPVLPGEFFDLPGFECAIQIDRKGK
jgi:hypothetical protein